MPFTSIHIDIGILILSKHKMHRQQPLTSSVIWSTKNTIRFVINCTLSHRISALIRLIRIREHRRHFSSDIYEKKLINDKNVEYGMNDLRRLETNCFCCSCHRIWPYLYWSYRLSSPFQGNSGPTVIKRNSKLISERGELSGEWWSFVEKCISTVWMRRQVIIVIIVQVIIDKCKSMSATIHRV